MADIYVALGMVAPLYNLALVFVAVVLFIKLYMTKNEKVFMRPWILLGVCVGIYIIEEVLTVLRKAGVSIIPPHINAFFELAIITIFLYTALMMRHYLKHRNLYVDHKAEN